MQVSDDSLRQLDEAYLRSLKPEALQDLSVRLLLDLKEAWDRLGSGPGTPTALASGIRQALKSDATMPVEPAKSVPAE